jgi:hypothetical protein
MHLSLSPLDPAPHAIRRPVAPVRNPPGGIRQRYAIDRADWIWDNNLPAVQPVFRRLRLPFQSNGQPLRFQVSADQFFWLMLNGHVIARGPDVSPPWAYGFAEYEVTLPAGTHELEAFVWWVGNAAPEARMTDGKAGFVLAGIGDAEPLLSTGIAPWKIAVVDGYEIDWTAKQAEVLATGKNGVIDARAFFANLACWQDPVVCQARLGTGAWGGRWVTRLMEPSNLPEMPLRAVTPGRIRAALDAPLADQPLPAEALNHPALPELQSLLGDHGAAIIPAHSRRTLVWDLENYFSGWPELVVSGGRDAEIRQIWSEGFYETANCRTKRKGNRNEIVGKYLVEGLGDRFLCDGGPRRRFIPYWWRCSRYSLIEITTADEPLTLHRLGMLESGHPFEWVGSFSCERDAALRPILSACLRTLEVSSWDSYEDCPYFEQLQYIGDTRLEILMTYVLNANAALPLRAIDLLEESRHQWHGVAASRFPCRGPQFISTFSLIWVWCVRDLLWWRNEPEMVRRLLPGVRQTLDLFEAYRNDSGLLENIPGWPFVDWIHPDLQRPGVWERGVPASAIGGVSALINLVYLLALQAAANLEEHAGEPELACLRRRQAEATAEKIRAAFWNPELRVLTDDASGKYLSSQAQIYGTLAGVLSPEEGSAAMDQAAAQGWIPPSYMFRFYEFEALRLLGRAGEIPERFGPWQEMIDLGAVTVWEHPEPSRSDCHAWSSHPLFHLPCSVAGIRPASPGFRTVRIAPQPGALKKIETVVAHPDGLIRLDLTVEKDRCAGTVELPAGISGEFVFGSQRQALTGGRPERIGD